MKLWKRKTITGFKNWDPKINLPDRIDEIIPAQMILEKKISLSFSIGQCGQVKVTKYNIMVK